MKQSGFLYKLNPTDYITGSSPIVWESLNNTADWRDYLPAEEKQHNFSFDTMSCTTFSALNVIETLVNFLIAQKKLDDTKLKELGCIKNGKAEFSDRFTAIMSGTMRNGNYFQSVMDSVRRDGLLPEADLPFGGNTWDEYHDKTKITEAMKAKALKIKDILDFAYEWVVVSSTSIELFEALKQSPIQVAVTKQNPTHAIMLPKMDYEFETYKPYLRTRARDIAYAMKIQVKPKALQAPTPSLNRKYKYFSDKEVIGLKHELVAMLDLAREKAGIPFKINSGLRSADKNKDVGGVSNSAHTRGYAADIACTSSANRWKIIKAGLDVGFKRIGDGETFVHLDCDPTLPQEVIWTYYK